MALSVDDDPCALLAWAHGACLRRLTGVMDMHFEGLAVAARRARRDGIIDNKRAKKLERLDIAYAVVRHASVPRMRDFVQDIEGVLKKQDEFAGEKFGREEFMSKECLNLEGKDIAVQAPGLAADTEQEDLRDLRSDLVALQATFEQRFEEVKLSATSALPAALEVCRAHLEASSDEMTANVLKELAAHRTPRPGGAAGRPRAAASARTRLATVPELEDVDSPRCDDSDSSVDGWGLSSEDNEVFEAAGIFFGTSEPVPSPYQLHLQQERQQRLLAKQLQQRTLQQQREQERQQQLQQQKQKQQERQRQDSDSDSEDTYEDFEAFFSG